MPYLDNPAGRLHDLLSRFESIAARAGTSFQEAWSTALRIKVEDLPLRLGDISRLMRDVERAANETNDRAFAPARGYLDVLAECVFPRTKAMNAGATRPGRDAMVFLDMMSSFLHMSAPDGKIPSEETLSELKSDVETLTQRLVEIDIDPRIKRKLLDRLNDVLEALGHLDIGGPEAATKAAEALASAAVLAEPEIDDPGVLTGLKLTARKVWAAFQVTVTLANALAAFDHAYHISDHLLAPPAAQRQLNPGAQESTGHHDGDDDGETIVNAAP